MLIASQHLGATHLKGFLCLLAEGGQGRCRGRANTAVVRPSRLPQLQQGELSWAGLGWAGLCMLAAPGQREQECR